jgi:putative sigma-54 modulation protein
MRIEIVGRNLEVTPAIREYAETKSDKLSKVYNGIQMITFRLTREDHHHHGEFGVELVVDVQHHADFVSHAKGEDLYGAIDAVIQKGTRQLSEHKAKIRDGKR